jgi:hypothetical protein
VTKVVNDNNAQEHISHFISLGSDTTDILDGAFSKE